MLELAIEVAWKGREGRKIGTLFVVGDEERVLEYSRPLILDDGKIIAEIIPELWLLQRIRSDIYAAVIEELAECIRINGK